MAERKFIIPEYGPFAGMRVICSGSLIAMPYAATMLADFGAEIIQIERPGVGDTLRMLAPFSEKNGKKVSTAWAQDGRNKLAMSLELNLKHEEVKEIFYGLIKESDIYMENMVWLDKLGINDEELLKVNPKLVIVHVSGLGHKEFGGVPSVCNRASYDMIGQAFSGWLYLQGDPDRDPSIAKPYMNDFVSAFACLRWRSICAVPTPPIRSMVRFRRERAITIPPSSPMICSAPRMASLSHWAHSGQACTRDASRLWESM